MNFLKKTFSRTIKTAKTQGPIAVAKDAVQGIEATLSGGSSGFSRSKRSSSRNNPEGIIFCSDMYSVDFILEEMDALAENGDVHRVVFEDLIERNHPEVLQKAKEFLVNTASDTPGKGKTLRGRQIRSNSVNSSEAGTCVKRVWHSITFVGCISDAEDYREYLEKKHQFQNELNRLLAMKRMNFVLPIRFKTKLELHSMLSLVSIIELLKEVQRDEDIAGVEFPQFDCKPSRIAKELAKQIDRKELEWTGQPVEILLSYDGEDLNTNNNLPNKSGSTELDVSRRKDRARKVLKSCIKVLEKTLHGNSSSVDQPKEKGTTNGLMVDESTTEDNTEFSADGGNIMPVPQLQKLKA